MKKIILIILIIFLVASAAVIYLNNVFLPLKIRSLIVGGLEEATQKKVTLESLNFSIFKGLVLKNLNIYDNEKVIVGLKEVSCAFLIPPIFQKRVIIPVLNFKSPQIFLERRPDNTFNLQDLFPKKEAAPQTKSGSFSAFIYKVNVKGGRIQFQDSTFSPAFTKDIEGLDFSAHLSGPGSIKFGLKSEVPFKANARGEFKISERQLLLEASVQGFAPGDFLPYYRGIAPEKVSGRLDSELSAEIRYDTTNKQLLYSGKAVLSSPRLSGLVFIDEINSLNGEIKFDNSGVTTDKVNANIWGVPVEAQAKLTDFKSPLWDIAINSSFGLEAAQKILKDRFNFAFPGNMQGQGNLSLVFKGKPGATGAGLEMNGYLDVSGATARIEKINPGFEAINGRIEFTQNQARWSDLNFRYLGATYKTSGAVTNFQAPGVQLELSSRDLSLRSNFAVNNKLITFSEFSAKYLNSQFSVTGSIDTKDAPVLNTNLSGALDVNLADTPALFKKIEKQLSQMNPAGAAHLEFNLAGNANDFKSCAVEVKASVPSISLYGLKAGDFFLNYAQAGGLAEIPLIHLSVYGGTIEASAKMNLNSDNLPYWITLDMQGVRLEELKMDTPAKTKDISGAIQGGIKLNGFSGDLSKLSGAGRINISEGRLWELDLFKGLGTLLFVKDFANIVFNEGSCSFLVRDNAVSTEDLKLKSTIANIAGSLRLGFDSAIAGELNVEILSNMVPLGGTFKDVTTAIIGQAEKFGVIKISGTLKKPEYKFKVSVPDIIKGLKDAIFGK